jgi:hypothetical protein
MDYKMRKSQVVDLFARRLGLRATRLTSLAQRLSDADLLPVSSGPPYVDLKPIEVARLMLAGLCDEGLGGAARTVQRYGRLQGRTSSLVESLAHTVQRPESLPPACSGLEIHQSDDQPYALMTVVTGDGATTNVYGNMPDVETVDRLVIVPGAALFAIASEINGMSSADVDALLEGATDMKPAAQAA